MKTIRTPGAVAPAAGFAFFAAVRSIWIAGFAVGVLILIAGLVQLTGQQVASGARRMKVAPGSISPRAFPGLRPRDVPSRFS